MNTSNHERRVVITGMGVIAPNGQDLKSFWNTVRLGISAADYITRFDTSALPCHVAAEVKNFVAADFMDSKQARRLERSQQYSLASASLAATDSALDLTSVDPDRCGIVEATSLSNVEAAYRGKEAYARRGYRAVGPWAMINGYVGSGSAEIANSLGLKGHAITCSSSSASGNDVMGYALSMIQNEDVDVMLAGGAEAPLIDTVWVGFAQAKAMTRWPGPPHEAMKPFDRRGDGFIMGEGGAYVVMEELTHALSRNARIYAEILAHGRSCEAYHPMAPEPEGKGVQRAMEKCLRRAGLDPSEIDYINAHGSANSPSDVAESRAINHFFGEHARSLAVSSTKPITGHPLAAAGSLETVICALSLKHEEIPMTLNFQEPAESCDLDYVPGRSRPYPIRSALNLSSGFGGKTSCLLLRSYPPT